MDNLIIGMNCPNCGGRIDVEEGRNLAFCPNCNAVHAIVGDEGVNKVMYRIVIDRDRAMSIITDWFKRGFKARDLKKTAEFTEVYPLYLPFWRLRATGKGVVCGYRWTTYTDSQGHTHRKKEYIEREVNNEYNWTQIACEAGDIGITKLRNLAGEVIPYSEEDIPTFEATTSRTDGLEKGKESIKTQVYSSANVENVTFSRVFVIPRGFTLIFYPFWIVRYNYRGRGYFASVDGVTGQVISGRAPGDPLWQSLAVAGGSSAGGVLTSLILASPNMLGVFAVIGGIGLMMASYQFFRHGSERIEGDLPRPGGSKFSEMFIEMFKNIRIGGF